MTTNPRFHSDPSVHHSALVRDLTLSQDAPIAFCLRLLLQEMRWSGRTSDLTALLGRDPRTLDLVDARNLLLRLGHSSRLLRLHTWQDLNSTRLPALYVSPDGEAYTLVEASSGGAEAVSCFGRSTLDSLAPGGWLLVLDDAVVNQRSSLLQILLYRFAPKIRRLYLVSFGLALLSLALPFYIRAVYNIAIPGRSVASASWLFIGGAFIFTLDLNLRRWRVAMLSQLSGRLDVLFGMKIVQKFLGLDFRQLEHLGLSGFSSRIRNLDSLLAYAQGPMALALLDFPFIIFYLVAIFWIAGSLVFVPLLCMLIGGGIVALLARYYTSAQDVNLSTGIGLFQAQQEMVSRFLELRLANLEWVWFQRLRGLSGQSTSSSLGINQQVGRLQILLTTTSQLAGVLTLSFGSWYAFSSGDPYAMGNLIAAMFLVWRIFTPFQYLMSALLRFDSVRKQYQQVDQFLRVKSNERQATSVHGFSRLSGRLELSGVSCRLGNDSSLQLARVTLKASPGELLALTGKSGSGKTVVLRLIDQLYPVSSGSLLFDGRDHRQFSVEELQSNIAYVLAVPQFLPGSIWQNLTAMNPDVRFQDVVEICQQLHLLPFFESLPQGFHTELDDGIVYQIPIGLRRLFSLAQALIKDSPILLIDNLSQGLDPEQFNLVMQILPTLRTSSFSALPRTVILSTDNKFLLEQVDRICILDKGVTAFEGTQEDLKARLQKSAPSSTGPD